MTASEAAAVEAEFPGVTVERDGAVWRAVNATGRELATAAGPAGLRAAVALCAAPPPARPSRPWLFLRRPDDPDVARFLTWMRLDGATADTVRSYRSTLTRAAAALAPVPMLAATPQQLYAWRAGLSGGDDSVRQYVARVHRFYAWATSEGLLKANPAKRLPRPRRMSRLPRPIEEDALFDAVARADGRVRLMLVLGAWAGLRAREIAGLQWGSVHLRSAEPFLLVSRETSKGGRKERVIPLSPFAAAELAAARPRSRGPVFPRLDSDGRPAVPSAPLTPARASALMCLHLHACGYADTAHALRHRFLTRAQRIGGDIRDTQQLAGHESIQSTMAYTLVDAGRLAGLVAAIPAPPGALAGRPGVTL